jgi:hypothetical protein
MAKFILFIFLFQFSVLFSQSRKVKVKLLQYVPYCGGSNSTKNLAKTPNKPVVYAKKKLIFISQDQNIDTLGTDKNGYLKLGLPYGTYLVYEPWKFYRTLPIGFSENNIDMDCMKEEWQKEDLLIVISKKTITIANNIILLKCPSEFPCLTKIKSSN